MKLTKIVNELMSDMQPLDYYSNVIVESGLYKEYESVCKNNNLICEASLSRMLSRIENTDFAIISAYRKKFTKDENIKRNRILRGVFDNSKMGVYMLVGHWQECQDENIPYDKCPKDKLIDVVERSFLVVRQSTTSFEEFKELILKYMTIDGQTQDGALMGISDNTAKSLNVERGYYFYTNTGQLNYIGKKLTLNKIGQAYSQLIQKMNVPFVFEGMEIPGSNSGRMLFKMSNLKYFDANLK